MITTVIVGAVCFVLGYIIPEPKWVANLIAKAKAEKAKV